ncbi:chemotaxis protein CheC [Anaerobranca gottschalkii]|uniref:Chemotaxis protein CheC n=1 Tax=Anaerobranca gottschalkii DSM 13577 TaxID=1120990 RepID=A0A1H9ZC91_9FIRM|nr:chemotaxis protein CheC [Anaerobranca gottschalkii]SES79160.1 chemotaxis protein CheC [Anaerobranca gottschalkii DSM 13577]
MNIYSLKPMQIDLLKELGNIGAGNAATALSKIISNKIGLSVPEVSLVSFQEALEFVGGEDQVVASIYFRVEGSLPGNILLMLPLETIKFILEYLLNDKNIDYYNLDSYQTSAISEIGNMLCGAYLTALSNFTQQNMYPSVPALSVDMAEAALSLPLIQMGEMGDVALLIKTTFTHEGKDVSGNFFFIPEIQAFEKLMSYFGVANE